MDFYLRGLHRLAVNGCQVSQERIDRFSPPRVWKQLKPCIRWAPDVIFVFLTEDEDDFWDDELHLRRITHGRHLDWILSGNARHIDAWALRTGWRINSTLRQTALAWRPTDG